MDEEYTKEFDFSILPQTSEKTKSLLIEKFQNALRSLASRQYEEGIKALKEVLEHEMVQQELHDLQYQCYFNLATVYEERQATREALLYYYKCVSLRENDFNTWLKLSNFCMRLHYFDQAEYCYQNCLKFIPSSFYENILYEKMIITSFLTKNYAVCQQRIDFLLPRNYKNAELLLLKSVVAKNRGNGNEAEKFKKEALALDPTLSEDKLIVNEILDSKPEALPPSILEPFKIEFEKIIIKEITISVDNKYNWDIFLKKIKDILKICFLLSEDLPISSKLKKKNLIKSILTNDEESYQTIMSSIFRIKDKKEKNAKALKETPKNEGDESPLIVVNQQEPMDDTEGANATASTAANTEETKVGTENAPREETHTVNKPFTIVRTENKKKVKPQKKKEETKGDVPIQSREKGSARIQNKKTQQIFSNISLEYILSNHKFKGDSTFLDLIDMYKDDFLDLNNIKADEDILNLHPPVQMVEEYSLNSMLNSFSHDAKSAIKEKLIRSANDDFFKFLKEIHNKKFANVILFAEKLLRHFLQNKQRDLPKDLQDVPFFLEAKVSLAFCPSYYLMDFKKKMIIKIYLYCYHFCENLISDYSSKLTLFELLIDYYMFKTSVPVKEPDVDKHNENMKRLKGALIHLSQSLLFGGVDFDPKSLGETNYSLLKVRSVLAYARFFLTEDFKCTASAKECLQLLTQELHSLDSWMELNTQTIENNIYVNMFWMKEKLFMSDQIEALNEKLKGNELKDNAYMHTDNEEKEESDELPYIEGLFKIFQEKIKSSLDNAVDTHYKKLYQKIAELKLNDFVFYLDKIFRILMELFWQSTHNDDIRKVLAHAYEQLKIKDLLGVLEGHLEKQKKIKRLIGKDELFTHKMANLASYCYRMIVVNYVVEYTLDFELFLITFFRIGQIMVRKLGAKEPVVSQMMFFKLYHSLIHYVTNEKITKYHIDLVKSSFRQDTTLRALNLLKEKYETASADEEDDRKNDNDDDDDEKPSTKEEMEIEISEIFACWYGIGGSKDIEAKEELQGIKHFKDVIIVYKYLEYFDAEYFRDPTIRFKLNISRALIDIYDYLKDHQGEWWDLCEGFKRIKQNFDQQLEGAPADGSLVVESRKISIPEDGGPIEEEKPHHVEASSIDEASQSQIVEKPGQIEPEKLRMELEECQIMENKPQEEQKNENKEDKIEEENTAVDLQNNDCFCEKKTCFSKAIKHVKSKDIKQTFSEIFYFIGKALDDTKPSGEISDTLKQRKILLRTEKMYSISASFFPEDPHICNALASTLIDQYILYYDQLSFDKVYDKFIEFEGCLRKARNLLSSILEMISTKKYSLFFKELKIEDINARVVYNMKVIKLLELHDLKFKLHIVHSVTEKELRDTIRTQIDAIRQELQTYHLNPTYVKDYYLSATMVLAVVPGICSWRDHQALVSNMLELCDIVKNASNNPNNTPFDKNLLSLYDLEAETHLFVMLFKIFRRYTNLLKYLNQDAFAQETQNKLSQEPKSIDSVEKLKKYILSDFDQFLKFLEREKKIELEQRKTTMEASQSVDKTSMLEEPAPNRASLDSVNEDNSEFSNLGGFLTSFMTDFTRKDQYQKKVEKDIEIIINNCTYEEPGDLSGSDILKTAEKCMIGIAKKLRDISQKKDTKRMRGAPFHLKCLLYSSKMFEEYFKDNKKALEIITQLVSGKCLEVVELYKYEKDPALALVYNRDLVFLRNKCKVVKNYTKLSYRNHPRESYEKSKFLSKKAYNLIAFIDKDKKNEKINWAYLRMYENTLEYVLDYLQSNVDKIEAEAASKKDTIQEEKNDKAGDSQENAIDDYLKNELKIFHEMIVNNMRSRSVAHIIKKNETLYKKLTDVIILYYERFAVKCGFEINQEKKFEGSLGFFDQLFKKRRTGGKKDDPKKEEDTGKKEDPKKDDEGPSNVVIVE